MKLRWRSWFLRRPWKPSSSKRLRLLLLQMLRNVLQASRLVRLRISTNRCQCCSLFCKRNLFHFSRRAFSCRDCFARNRHHPQTTITLRGRVWTGLSWRPCRCKASKERRRRRRALCRATDASSRFSWKARKALLRQRRKSGRSGPRKAPWKSQRVRQDRRFFFRC